MADSVEELKDLIKKLNYKDGNVLIKENVSTYPCMKWKDKEKFLI